jgi:hemerythrin-like domain-containing protein
MGKSLGGNIMTQPTSELARGLLRIHKVITRGLEVGLRAGGEYLDKGFTQSQQLTGYAYYVYSLGADLKAHHTSEDMVVFPEARKVLPMAPYERLASDHQKIEKNLTPLFQAVADLSGEMPEKSVKLIVDALEKISAVWYPHIQVEESNFSEAAMSSAFPLGEQMRIGEAASKLSQEYATPPYWVIPFTLFNLEPEERKMMLALLPPAMMDELVLKAWKDQWSPMKPFLLD